VSGHDDPIAIKAFAKFVDHSRMPDAKTNSFSFVDGPFAIRGHLTGRDNQPCPDRQASAVVFLQCGSVVEFEGRSISVGEAFSASRAAILVGRLARRRRGILGRSAFPQPKSYSRLVRRSRIPPQLGAAPHAKPASGITVCAMAASSLNIRE